MVKIDNKTILTPTSGFLSKGYTHTVNLYSGCAFANTLCGVYCYAQHNHWITQGRKWGLYGVKQNITETYKHQYKRIKLNSRKPGDLKIYMSSVTDPYLPQERQYELTKAILTTMLQNPPDVLVIQTRSILIERDFELILELSQKCTLWISMTVETDYDLIPGFPKQAFTPGERMDVLKRFYSAGINAQATISPLLPIKDVKAFGGNLAQSANRIIVDHYLLGDGTHGLRTQKTSFISRLIENGFEQWATLEKFHEVFNILSSQLGSDRVLMSNDGFNSV